MKYDFECKKCNKVYEVEQKMTETTDSTPCPDCGGEANKVFLTPNSIVFSGPGWTRKYHR